jgi:iron complex transport system ATP-binding protein
LDHPETEKPEGIVCIMNDTIAVLEDLAIGYVHLRGPDHIVAHDLDLSLAVGELVCLIGPNGVGKSTLLRTIAGMQSPLDGRVLLDGHDIRTLKASELARLLSIVLTERIHVGILSAYALVALGRTPYTDWTGRLTTRDQEIVRWAIRIVGATELASRNVGELSDGERQKVMIARALAQEPRLMILDEPTAFLDLPRRVEIMRILRRLARTSGSAVLLSTHDLDLALRSADRIWLMRSGGIIEVGAPEDLVLSGAFEATFDSEGIEFDREAGSFKIHTDRASEILLRGSGIEVTWTRRALEREGFCVQDNGHPDLACVEVVRSGNNTTWGTTIGEVTHMHSTLYETISFLRHINTANHSQRQHLY